MDAALGDEEGAPPLMHPQPRKHTALEGEEQLSALSSECVSRSSSPFGTVSRSNSFSKEVSLFVSCH